jgi:hypothetical protein
LRCAFSVLVIRAGKQRGEEGMSAHLSKPSTFLIASKMVVSGLR